MDKTIDAATIHLMRAASGLGMMDCKDAARMAVDELQGDLVLALLVRHAHGFAVNVRSRDPAVSDAEARRRWDIEHALGSRDGVAARTPDWAKLDAMSPRYVDERGEA